MNSFQLATCLRRSHHRSRPADMQTNKPGFTLIELLVVISIIAMLVAILLPALTQARLAAQGALCLSRLRQFGIAVQTYRTDWNEYYPTAALDDLSLNWLTQIQPYIDPSNTNKWSRLNTPADNIYLCPASPHTASHNTAALIRKYAHINAWRVHNYTISRQFGWPNTGNNLTGGGPRRIFHGDHSRVPMVGEGKGSNERWGREAIARYWAEQHRGGYFPHSGETTNYLFLDSHAANVGTTDEVAQKIIGKEIIFKPRYE